MKTVFFVAFVLAQASFWAVASGAWNPHPDVVAMTAFLGFSGVLLVIHVDEAERD